MNQLLHLLAVGLGLLMVAATLLSAIRTFVLPRGDNASLTRLVFLLVYQLFRIRLWSVSAYARQDKILALYPPLALLVLPVVWLSLITGGYMAIFWGLGVQPWFKAFLLSGSSLLTLGFAPVDGLLQTVAAFSEATLGLGMVALLIAYLPAMYAAFSSRETAVTLLEVRAGSPPSAVEMIIRFHRIQGLNRLTEHWATWEIWFAEVDESHTSLAPVIFFRSPNPARSWITAAGAVLDGAALAASCLNIPRHPQADLCIRAGYIALRNIADLFHIPYDPNPQADDPISITRVEFEAAWEELAAAGVPLKADRAQAWRDFAGWRVNYDTVLLALAQLTRAPETPWINDAPRQRIAAGIKLGSGK